jgi:hypothetical protein
MPLVRLDPERAAALRQEQQLAMVRVRMRGDRPIVLAAPNTDSLDVQKVELHFPPGFAVEKKAGYDVLTRHRRASGVLRVQAALSLNDKKYKTFEVSSIAGRRACG